MANEAGFYSLSTIDTNGCEGGSVPILISMPDTFINTESVGNLRFCEGDSVLLQAKKNGYDTYLWNPGNFYGKDYMVFETGICQLIATDTFGCDAFSTKYTIYAEPNLIGTPLGFDTTICIGTVANLSAITNFGEIEWLDSITNDRVAVGADFVTNPIFENTTFLVWSNHDLCKSDSAYVTVFVQDCNTPEVPNIFTPNGDGLNDIFRMSLIENKCFHGYIYNRWGALIFETQHMNIGWDGTEQNTGEAVPEGTYFFVFEYCKHDSTEGTSQGTVTLIRD
jgi:gliding motility-associated-like protein